MINDLFMNHVQMDGKQMMKNKSVGLYSFREYADMAALSYTGVSEELQQESPFEQFLTYFSSLHGLFAIVFYITDSSKAIDCFGGESILKVARPLRRTNVMFFQLSHLCLNTKNIECVNELSLFSFHSNVSWDMFQKGGLTISKNTCGLLDNLQVSFSFVDHGADVCIECRNPFSKYLVNLKDKLQVCGYEYNPKYFRNSLFFGI